MSRALHALLLGALLISTFSPAAAGAGEKGPPGGGGGAVPVEAVPESPLPSLPVAGDAGRVDAAPSPPAGIAASPAPYAGSPLPAGAEGDLARVRALAREGRYDEAKVLLLPLMAKSPANGELLALRARLLFGEQRFEESLPFFREALLSREDPELRREMERARLAVVLGNADRLSSEGKDLEAEALLRPEYASGAERYETGRRLGRVYLRQREFSRAAVHYREMTELYPAELDFKASLVEALLLSDDADGARKVVGTLSPGDREALSVGREDLFYRMSASNVRLLGEYVSPDRGRHDEDRFAVEGTFRTGGVTAVAGASTVSRFGSRDERLSLDLASAFGEGADGFGTLSLSVSPGSDFLPRWTAGVEVGESIRRHDVSAGYRHLHLQSSDAGIATAAITAWLPVNVAVGERLSMALSTRAWSSLTTLRYEPDHTLRIFASISFGTLAERPESSSDLRSRFGYADRGGFEYRPRVEYSWGGEFFHEHRDSEGDRLGGSVFARYWW